jgi:hypothetical protein
MTWNDGSQYEGEWKDDTFFFPSLIWLYNNKELTMTTEYGYIVTITDKD